MGNTWPLISIDQAPLARQTEEDCTLSRACGTGCLHTLLATPPPVVAGLARTRGGWMVDAMIHTPLDGLCSPLTATPFFYLPPSSGVRSGEYNMNHGFVQGH